MCRNSTGLMYNLGNRFDQWRGNMKIIFIGGGNMAEAIFAKLHNCDVVVVQRNLEKLIKLQAKYPKIKFLGDLNFITGKEDLVFIAVKPQDAKETCRHISNKTRLSPIISVMSGISCATLGVWLKNEQICRAMPNTPSMLGVGACGVYITPLVESSITQLILDVFGKIGKVYPFIHEDQINQMTAVGGSSPAYVFYFIEAMIKAAINQFAFSEEIARDITLQVIKGSLAMIEHNENMSITELRTNVTSKKGTTEQAINVFEKYNLMQIISEAEHACYDRAKEISKVFAHDE
jgi:pyrroline-5-carboxylate reductase